MEEYILQTHDFFLTQIKDISEQGKRIIEQKIKLAKINPYRNKRIYWRNFLLFRIRFEDNRKEKRIIYLVEKPFVKILCILDRDKEYKDLEKYLKKSGYIQ